MYCPGCAVIVHGTDREASANPAAGLPWPPRGDRDQALEAALPWRFIQSSTTGAIFVRHLLPLKMP